tara:strand:+ start:507 stop:2165 length:1659 start_codon:yes stop_codon:yes gene_type:complete
LEEDMKEHKEACPKCRELGNDTKGDNLHVYADGQTHCYACDYHTFADNNSTPTSYKPRFKKNTEAAVEGVHAAITDRKISKEIATKYKVKVEYGTNGQVIKHHYPFTDKSCRITAWKTRDVATKGFHITGSFKDVGLFGECLWDAGGKYLTITEGEIDCMSLAEVFNGKWATVSLRNGAQSVVKSLKDSFEFVDSFDKIVLAFDNDEAGKVAIDKVLEIFSPDKIKIMSYPDGYKDVSDMLQAGLVKDLENCWWRAKTYMPSDIVGATEVKDSWISRPHVQSIPYPWVCLNQKTKGFRLGELVTITSGTGMGKSSLIRELEHHLLTTTTDKVGIIHLEETTERTIDGLVGIELSVPYHLDEIRQNYPEHEATAAFDKLFKREDGEEALSLYEGKELSVEKIVSRIRLMAKAQNIRWIILDHLNLVMSGDTKVDERRSIDQLMTQLREVVVETNIGLFVISHLSRQQGVTHEEGGEISLTHLRGSQGIAQLSNIVIALERNQQHEDDWMRNVTKLRVLKNRYTGDTGETGHIHYDNDTGRLTEVVVDLEELLS